MIDLKIWNQHQTNLDVKIRPRFITGHRYSEDGIIDPRGNLNISLLNIKDNYLLFLFSLLLEMTVASKIPTYIKIRETRDS